jgi:hypothetical protein
LSQDQAAQAAMSLSAITGMNSMDSMMAVTDAFGTAPGLSAQGPSHSSGVSFADIAVAHALGLGNQDVNSGQTVNQAIAAAAVHSGLNNNIGQVMGVLGGPVVGMIATAANAVAQGHSFSSVVGQIAASIVGTAISNATGLAVNANTVSAIANGQIGQAAMGLAIGQVAQSTGLSIGTVTAAMSGNLGAAVANTVMGQVVGAAAQAMSTGPLGGMAIGAIANQSGIPAGIANSINQSAIGQAVNSATSAINSSISSAGIGVPGGPSGVASAVSAASSGADGSAPSLGDVLTSSVNSGALEKAAVSTPPSPGAPAAPSGPSSLDRYWQNLYSDLGMAFSKPPAQKANNTANEMYANQAKAQALIDAEKKYTDIFGALPSDVAASLASAADPLKYVNDLTFELTQDMDSDAADQLLADLGLSPSEGTYTGVNLAGPGEGSSTGTFVPSWMSLASDERIVGTRWSADGEKRYIVERINPNNPEQFTTYQVSRDSETGKIYYESGGMDESGNMTTVASQKKPTVEWDAEEGVPTSPPEENPTDYTPPVDDFIDSFIRDLALAPPKPEPSIDDLIKDSEQTQQSPTAPPVTPPATPPVTPPTEPSVTPPVEQPVTPPATTPTANVTPQEVEKIVNDALKANPNLAEEDVQRIVSDAVAAIPNLTADQVRQIVGSELTNLPVSATPADVQTAVDAAQAASNAQYNALTAAQKAEADARVAQGQSLQDAITGVAGQVTEIEGQLTQQGKDFAAQLMQQGMNYTTAMQTAISAQSALFGSQLSGVQDEIAANEARRIADQQAAAERARQVSVRGGLRTTALQGQQQLQALQQQLPQAVQMSQTTSTPIYGEMGPYLDLGSPLDFDFFKPSPEKQAATKQAQPTKIAAGGYIDDLLAEGMSVDDLMNLLR